MFSLTHDVTDTRFTLIMKRRSTPSLDSPIAARRKELGSSQYAISKLAGIPQSHLRKIELGLVASPSVHLALRLADALKADVRTLFPAKAA